MGSWGDIGRTHTGPGGTFSDAERDLYSAAMKNMLADVQEKLCFGAEPDRYQHPGVSM
eukprot:COSAG01_NODE_614_length_14830_cov_87.820572_10_plen_58_part_00